MEQKSWIHKFVAITIFLLSTAFLVAALFGYCEIIGGRHKVDTLFCTGEGALLGRGVYLLVSLAVSIFIAVKTFRRHWLWIFLPLAIGISFTLFAFLNIEGPYLQTPLRYDPNWGEESDTQAD